MAKINKEFEIIEADQDMKIAKRDRLFSRAKKTQRRINEYREKIDCLKNERWTDTIGVNLDDDDDL
jgi:hypothetical protein